MGSLHSRRAGGRRAAQILLHFPSEPQSAFAGIEVRWCCRSGGCGAELASSAISAANIHTIRMQHLPPLLVGFLSLFLCHFTLNVSFVSSSQGNCEPLEFDSLCELMRANRVSSDVCVCLLACHSLMLAAAAAAAWHGLLSPRSSD